MEIGYSNTGEVIDDQESPEPSQYYEMTESEKELLAFIVDHTDRWREYRDQNFATACDRYERIWRGIWAAEDKGRD